MPKINRKFFFDYAKQHLFDGSLKQSQVDGMSAILDCWETSYSANDDRWLAYIFATVHHETDRTFKGIEEYGPNSYCKKHDGRSDLGNNQPGDGLRCKGRGFVQLTGRLNYTTFSQILHVYLIGNPSLALELPNCVKILFYGMTKGTFTGKKLSDYFNTNSSDWINARKIINKLDKANLIASYGNQSSYGNQYYAAVSYTT